MNSKTSFDALDTSFEALKMNLKKVTTVFRRVFETGRIGFQASHARPTTHDVGRRDPCCGSRQTHIVGLSHYGSGDLQHAQGCLLMDALQHRWLGLGFAGAGLVVWF